MPSYCCEPRELRKPSSKVHWWSLEGYASNWRWWLSWSAVFPPPALKIKQCIIMTCEKSDKNDSWRALRPKLVTRKIILRSSLPCCLRRRECQKNWSVRSASQNTFHLRHLLLTNPRAKNATFRRTVEVEMKERAGWECTLPPLFCCWRIQSESLPFPMTEVQIPVV